MTAQTPFTLTHARHKRQTNEKINHLSLQKKLLYTFQYIKLYFYFTKINEMFQISKNQHCLLYLKRFRGQKETSGAKVM